ncbi:MAG: O-antigen ligase family protein [Candidatus Aenigmatarchaeota archaeon]
MSIHILKKTKIAEFLNFLVVILLFFGYAFYNILIFSGYISPFLGSYWVFLSLVSFLVLLPIGLKEVIRTFVLPSDLLEKVFYVYVLYNLSIYFWYLVITKPQIFYIDIFVWSMSGLFNTILMYLIGYTLSIKRSYIIIYTCLFFILFSLLLISFISSDFTYIAFNPKTIDENLSTYQGIARSILVISVILLAYYIENSFFLTYVIFLLTNLMLFIIGSRTDFVVFIISYILTLILFRFGYFLKSIILSVVILIISVTSFPSFYDLVYNSRIFTLFDLSQNESYNLRRYYLASALEKIKESPIFGDYGFYVFLDGIGSYPHNVFLSAWVNLGVVGFVIMIIIYMLLIFNYTKHVYIFILNKIEKDINIKYYLTLLSLLLYIVTISSIARDYSYMLIGFIIGVYSKSRKTIFRLRNTTKNFVK